MIDEKREELDLKIHVQEHCYQVEDNDDDEDDEPAGTIFDLLDTSAGAWDEHLVNGLYTVSCQCLEQSHHRRPKVGDF